MCAYLPTISSGGLPASLGLSMALAPARSMYADARRVLRTALSAIANPLAHRYGGDTGQARRCSAVSAIARIQAGGDI